MGTDCYKCFNASNQRRPCWWCPTVRAMIRGEPVTSFTHSPSPPKNRVEHFRVTASVLKERGVPVAAIESTMLATRELEGRNLATRLLETDDEDEVFGLAVECLGRGTRNDCILFATMDDVSRDARIEKIYTVDGRVLRSERQARPEWDVDTLCDDCPPPDQYFADREARGYRLFRRRPHHPVIRRGLSPYANECIWRSLDSKEAFNVIPPEQVPEFFRGTQTLSPPHSRTLDPTYLPRAAILRIGPRQEPLGCMIMLDKNPGWPCFEESGHGRDWCVEIASQVATKIRSMRLHRYVVELADFRESIIEQAPVGVLITDHDGTIIRTNQAWRNMAGGDITGTNLFALRSIRKAGLVATFREAMRGKEIQFDDAAFRTVFGRELVLSTGCVPMRSANGRITGLLLMCWDMTKIASHYEALMSAREQVALAGFAAGSIHEIKHPALTAAFGAEHTVLGLSHLVKVELGLRCIPFPKDEFSLLRARIEEACERARGCPGCR